MIGSENYSVENARNFKWSSVSGDLHPVRVSHLDKYIIGQDILDCGCGGGAYVEFLAAKGLSVTGIDKYDVFLDIARKQARLGTYSQGDITELGFEDKSFDCTYCYDVLEHVDDKLALKEMARVTRRRLILAVPKEDELMTKYGLTFFHYQDKTHLRNYTESSLRALVETIVHSKSHIFPELAVLAGDLVRDMIEFTRPRPRLRSIVFNRLLGKMLDRASYKRVYTGLVAVVDL